MKAPHQRRFYEDKEKMGMNKLRRNDLGETNLINSLISDF
jgi:hypothetical protein